MANLCVCYQEKKMKQCFCARESYSYKYNKLIQL